MIPSYGDEINLCYSVRVDCGPERSGPNRRFWILEPLKPAEHQELPVFGPGPHLQNQARTFRTVDEN